MRNNNNKGFMLIETLLVSVFVVSTLIFVYIQFEKVRNSYQTSFEYNTINGVYGADTILKYLKENEIENLNNAIKDGRTYVDISNCPGGYLSNTSFCQRLLTDLKVKKIFYTTVDITEFKKKINQAAISNKLKQFIRSIKSSDETGYRLIVEYEDNTYATILTNRKPKPTPSAKPTPTPIPTPSGPNGTLRGTTTASLANGFKLAIDYTVTKNSSTNKATVQFSVGNISGTNTIYGSSFLATISSGSSSMTQYLMLNQGNGQFVVNGVSGSINVTQNISMSATSASLPISVEISGNTQSVTATVTWNDSNLK